jgi:hypothetical protein
LVAIAAINPQFAADPFDEGSNDPHLPVRFLRYAAALVLLAAQVYIAALKPIRRRPPRNAAANFALAQNYSFRADVLPRACRGRRAPVTGLVSKSFSQQMIKNRRGRLLAAPSI